MEKLLSKFEYLSDATDKIDQLTKDAASTRGRKEKASLLKEAQELADAYQRHCTAGGNDKTLFNKISES